MKRKPFKRIGRAIRNNAALVAFVFGMLFFRTGVADWSYVPTGSMEPTFYGGEWVIVDKTAYGPTVPFTSLRLWTHGEPGRGDVITFYPPHVDKLYVKRVIGIPGDRIAIDATTIFVNSEPLVVEGLHEEGGYLIGRERIGAVEHSIQFSPRGATPAVEELIVPEGKYFVLGDHRNNSVDSRYWGFADASEVTGKVTSVAVSLSGRREGFWSRFAIPVD